VWSLDTAGLARANAPRTDLEVRMRGVALAGVFLRVSPFASRAGLDRDALMAAVGERLGRFFGRRGQRVVEANLRVIGAAFDAVQNVTEAVAGDRVPVSPMPRLLEAMT
jgi:pyruvate-ferredoxin/flavodoxin oxidoreductase